MLVILLERMAPRNIQSQTFQVVTQARCNFWSEKLAINDRCQLASLAAYNRYYDDDFKVIISTATLTSIVFHLHQIISTEWLLDSWRNQFCYWLDQMVFSAIRECANQLLLPHHTSQSLECLVLRSSLLNCLHRAALTLLLTECFKILESFVSPRGLLQWRHVSKAPHSGCLATIGPHPCGNSPTFVALAGRTPRQSQESAPRSKSCPWSEAPPGQASSQ